MKEKETSIEGICNTFCLLQNWGQKLEASWEEWVNFKSYSLLTRVNLFFLGGLQLFISLVVVRYFQPSVDSIHPYIQERAWQSLVFQSGCLPELTPTGVTKRCIIQPEKEKVSSIPGFLGYWIPWNIYNQNEEFNKHACNHLKKIYR